MNSFLFIATTLLFCFSIVATTTTAFQFSRNEQLDTIFDPSNNLNPSLPISKQWIGADCDISTELNERYSVMVFGDTLIGTIADVKNPQKRHRISPPGSHMPHSSIGIFDKETKKVLYQWGENETSLLRFPGQEDKSKFFWGSGITPIFLKEQKETTFCVTGERIFMTPKTPTAGNWNFYENGTLVVCVTNIYESDNFTPKNPKEWKQHWSQIPHTGNLTLFDSSTLEWRNAIYYQKSEDQFYLFGDYVLKGHSSSHQILSKISRQDFLNFNWNELKFLVRNNNNNNSFVSLQEFFSPQNWKIKYNLKDLKPLWEGWFASIPEFTVEYSPLLQKYFVMFIPTYSRKVQMRTSDTIDGNWTQEEPMTVWNLPDLPGEKNNEVFCYALKFHKSLNLFSSSSSNKNNLKNNNNLTNQIFSYVCNTQKLSELYQDGVWSEIYTPRFVNVLI